MFPFYRHLKKIFDLNPIQHVPYFEKLARGILELRRSGSVGRRDLVQLMLEATEENNTEVTDEALTDEEIIAQCITFLVAGSETTGSTLAFIAYYLAYYPEVQDKLLREIDDATRSRGDVSTYEFVQSLEYLDRVVSEVLRLCTVGYVNVRDCMETCVINGVEFPAGASVYILSYCVHRDPDYWPEVGLIFSSLFFYYIDTSVLLKNTPLIKFIRNYIRDLSGVFSIYIFSQLMNERNSTNPAI